jgi:hypothetical protein
METIQEKQIRMYGETVEEMRKAVMFTDLNDPASLVMYAMGILSDAQEELILGDPERARKYMNKAKYFMSEANYILRSR